MSLKAYKINSIKIDLPMQMRGDVLMVLWAGVAKQVKPEWHHEWRTFGGPVVKNGDVIYLKYPVVFSTYTVERGFFRKKKQQEVNWDHWNSIGLQPEHMFSSVQQKCAHSIYNGDYRWVSEEPLTEDIAIATAFSLAVKKTVEELNV